jgi:ABC-type transporter Mla MlaB component
MTYVSSPRPSPWHRHCFTQGVGGRKTQVLRISVASDSSQAIQFRLEGNLAGPWVEELRKLTDEALTQKKVVSLDLHGVRFVDTQGVALLREFSRRRISQMNCSQFVIQQMKEVEP